MADLERRDGPGPRRRRTGPAYSNQEELWRPEPRRVRVEDTPAPRPQPQQRQQHYGGATYGASRPSRPAPAQKPRSLQSDFRLTEAALSEIDAENGETHPRERFEACAETAACDKAEPCGADTERTE